MFPKCLNILHGVACTWSSVPPILVAWVVVLHSDLLFIRSLCCHYCVTLKSQFRWKAFNFCYVWVTSLVQKSVLCKITAGNITVHKKSEVFSGKIHGVRWPLSLIPSKISYFLPCSQIVNKIYSYLIFFSNFTCSLESIKKPCSLVPLICTNDLSYPGAHVHCSFSY